MKRVKMNISLTQSTQDFNKKYSHLRSAIYNAISRAKNILLISHAKPDGDTSGSAIAMAKMLEKFGKRCRLFCHDPLPDEFHFLPSASEYVHDIDPSHYDLAICFDGGTYKMFQIHEKYPEIFDGTVPLLNIDHHISNEQYGTWNIVEEKDASTTIVVAKLFRSFGWNLTSDTATPLLMGLYTDTGSLMHSNATASTHREAAELIKNGADLQSISKCIFQTKSFNRLKLWGKVLTRAKFGTDGITTSYIHPSDFSHTKTIPDDLTGVVDYLNSVPGAKFSLLLTQKENKKVKGSLRTLREDIDLTKIAGVFGGGGHKKASGFTTSGELVTERRWMITGKEGAPLNFEKLLR